VEKDPQEFFAALGKNVRIIHGLLRQISKLEQDTISNAYKIDNLFKKLIQNLSEIPLKELRDELEGWINGKTRELEASKERFRSRFGGELEKILQQKLSLSLRGQSQKFYAGFYTIALDFDHGNASIYYGVEQEFLAKTKLTPSDVTQALEKAHKALIGRKFDPRDFLAKLHEAYSFALRRSGKSEGEKLPILEVLRELVLLMQDKQYYVDPRKEHFKGYGRAYFSYDLYRLGRLDHANKRLELTVATREHTTKRDQFLWIPTNDRGEGTTYSYLAFREVNRS